MRPVKIAAFVAALLFAMPAKAENSPLLKSDSVGIKLVALTLLGEARGEGYAGMYFVACVIQQRSIERKKDCATICLQPRQFECWNGLHGNGLELIQKRKWLFDSIAAPDALRLARFIVRGGKLKRELVGFANHFCTSNSNPWWSKAGKLTAAYGGHKFFRLQ